MSSTRRGRLRVLVVDDEEGIRWFLAQALESRAEVITAKDVKEALGLLAQYPKRAFDLAIIDCILPGKSGERLGGLELLRALAAEWPWLPAIAMTAAAGSEAMIIEAFRSGARDFLKKPFRLGELYDACARVLSPRRHSPSVEVPRVNDALLRSIRFIDEHYGETIPLTRIAAVAGVSTSHFCRLFRSVTGKSFRDYLRTIRLVRAQQLLIASTLSLTEVALEAGFYDLPHFDKVFRKHFGISPTDFRRRKGLTRRGRPAVSEASSDGPRAMNS